jgi:hypothetical protein
MDFGEGDSGLGDACGEKLTFVAEGVAAGSD